MKDPVVAFIGAGQMAGAILAGLLNDGWPRERLLCLDVRPERLKELQNRYQVQTTDSFAEAVAGADVCVLAVKPADMAEVCTALGGCAGAGQTLFVSIAAGVSVDSIGSWLGADTALVRAMPNLAIEVGLGVSALYAGKMCTEAHKECAEKIFAAGGTTLWIGREDDMHLVTAVSGSGPGFFFFLLEEMIEAVVDLGLDRHSAARMVLGTAHGAARMAVQPKISLAGLRERVTSTGGTTARGLERLRQAGLRELFESVFSRAAQRSRELSAQPVTPKRA